VHNSPTRSPSKCVCTLWPCELDLWPFDLILIDGWGIMMDYPCAEFGDFSFSRFGFIVRTDRQTDRQTDTRTRMIAILTRPVGVSIKHTLLHTCKIVYLCSSMLLLFQTTNRPSKYDVFSSEKNKNITNLMSDFGYCRHLKSDGFTIRKTEITGYEILQSVIILAYYWFYLLIR